MQCSILSLLKMQLVCTHLNICKFDLSYFRVCGFHTLVVGTFFGGPDLAAFSFISLSPAAPERTGVLPGTALFSFLSAPPLTLPPPTNSIFSAHSLI